MLKGQGIDSQVVNRKLNPNQSIQVRLVRVTLRPLEYEVLVTSRVDELTYPHERFKELYHLRWGIETGYGWLKTRLEWENFSGKTVESLYPDCYATVYLTGLESLLTWETHPILGTQNTSVNSQPVNHNVSFHAIQSEALNWLLSHRPIPKVLNKLRALFLTHPTLNKKKPHTPRKNRTARHLWHYPRTQRQHGF